MTWKDVRQIAVAYIVLGAAGVMAAIAAGWQPPAFVAASAIVAGTAGGIVMWTAPDWRRDRR